MARVLTALCLAFPASVLAEVVVFEGNALPETLGWERAGSADADRWLDPASGGDLEGDWFCHYCDLGVWAPGPIGETDFYRMSVAPFAGADPWFIEWRVATDAPPVILDTQGTPVAVSAYGNGNALYHFTITDGRIRVVRDTGLPVIYMDIAQGVPHTYRVELRGEQSYAWYLDGELIDSGTPYGMYPLDDSKVIWGARYHHYPTTTCWDYLRYGDMPADASGDFDSSGTIDGQDFYFFAEYFSGEGVDAGPGARWADFDADTDVDCADWEAFQLAWTDTVNDPPIFFPCFGGGPIPTVSDWGVAVMLLLVTTCATLAHRPKPIERPQT